MRCSLMGLGVEFYGTAGSFGLKQLPGWNVGAALIHCRIQHMNLVTNYIE